MMRIIDASAHEWEIDVQLARGFLGSGSRRLLVSRNNCCMMQWWTVQHIQHWRWHSCVNRLEDGTR